MDRIFNGNGPCPLIYEKLLAYRLLPNASIYIAPIQSFTFSCKMAE